jgi:hypothetical protein
MLGKNIWCNVAIARSAFRETFLILISCGGALMKLPTNFRCGLDCLLSANDFKVFERHFFGEYFAINYPVPEFVVPFRP